jgi:hypothetical protein
MRFSAQLSLFLFSTIVDILCINSGVRKYSFDCFAACFKHLNYQHINSFFVDKKKGAYHRASKSGSTFEFDLKTLFLIAFETLE